MMNNKKILLTGMLILGTVGLVGCSQSEIQYDGKLRPVSEVEEIMADKLEVENPGLDLEVSIYDESDE